MPAIGAIWRAEIDAVEFHVDGGYRFVVHRNVFRTLRGSPAAGEVCVAFTEAHGEAFLAAAQARIASDESETTRAFHLNSRQVRRAMTGTSNRTAILREPGPR
ncbi:hypothetical protein [Rhizobium sp. Leaf341]|uniref:hypothetical protein n=1 Tax=Rhizobium sp. Leaf341 TaxID=1736344 RepID=UPI0007142463|nr:hypothetical protein [Rhizobium sp. Leaf341]KQR69334.1 hypothetical protein ASG03_09135 [Rhizobium sp. Leaf341]